MTLLHYRKVDDSGDADAVIQRLRRNSIVVTGVLAALLWATTGSLRQALGLIAAAALMLLNFNGLVAVANALLGGIAARPRRLHVAFLLSRHVLLAILLCAIVLLPGVGPVPVALGLSVLVLAILIEAIAQALPGVRRP